MSKFGADTTGVMLEMGQEGVRNHMPDVTIVYWRDMPAQVIVGRGRKGTKMPLPERFEQAIDRAAMKSGMAGQNIFLRVIMALEVISDVYFNI